MAWTVPATAVPGQLDADFWNEQVRDNLLYTLPGRADDVGQYPVSTGLNTYELRKVSSISTGSGSPVTVPPNTSWTPINVELTPDTGDTVLVFWASYMIISANHTDAACGVRVNGDDPDDGSALVIDGVDAANATRHAAMRVVTGLTPGPNTFSVVGSAGSGSCDFHSVELIIIPL